MARGPDKTQMNFVLSYDLYYKLNKKLEDHPYERSAAAVIRALIRKWVKGEIDLDNTEVIKENFPRNNLF